jgi:hypothetical protein
MKRFKIALSILTLALLASCGNHSDKDFSREMNYNDTGYQEDYNSSNDQNVNYQNNGDDSNYKSGRNKAVGAVDRNTGIQMWSTELPSNWDFSYTLDYSKSKDFPNSDWQAKNDKAGVTARNIRSKTYFYSTNQSMMQYFQQTNQDIAQPQSAGAIQQGTVSSMMEQKGYKKTGEGRSQAHENRLARAARAYNLSNLQMAAIASDWTAPDGRKAQTILFHVIMPNQTETTWWYETVVIEGQGKNFDKVARDFSSAIAETQDNPKWIQYTQQVIAQQNTVAQQNFNANQQRINNNQRNFEAQQRAIVGANDAVNQSIMDNWKTQNQASDYNQSQFIDYIRDEQNVYDPNSGNTYKVESGYDQYYINNSGEYIGTNDANYNPNLDPTINNETWNGTEPYY